MAFGGCGTCKMMSRYESECAFIVEGSTVERSTLLSHLPRYIFASTFVKGGAVLDVACGSGYGSLYMADRGAGRVVGGDIDTYAIFNLARNHLRRANLSFVVLDAARLPFRNDVFDVIVCLETIEHLREPSELLAECRRVVKRGGTLVCSTPTRELSRPLLGKGWSAHRSEMTLETFVGICEAHFGSVEEIFGQDFLDLRGRVLHKARNTVNWVLRDLGLGVVSVFLSRLCFKTDHSPVVFSSRNFLAGHLKDEIIPLRYANTRRLVPKNFIVVARPNK